jgi:heme-degrading monooxygenase HmoA
VFAINYFPKERAPPSSIRARCATMTGRRRLQLSWHGARPAAANSQIPEAPMICRLWFGWTSPGNADAYEALLKAEIFPGIMARKINGLRHIELLRRDVGEEVEFATIIWFDSLADVKAFAGDDYETAVVPPKARAVLARFDPRSRHYDVRARRDARA